MPMYRVHQNLAVGDSIVSGGSLSLLRGVGERGIQALLKRGTITEVAAPPLAILPGWKLRAARLKAMGVETVADLLQADRDGVARFMRANLPTVEKWLVDAEAWLLAPPPERG